MVEIPDPLPRDVEALQKLARELARENQQERRRIEKLEHLIRRIEHLVALKQREAE
jgi:hypothetical protein